jgi:hypothetical protein
MNNKLLKERISEADRVLTVAEEDLDVALSALRKGPRSDKTIATQAIEDAFVKLRAARAEVKRLAELVSEDDDKAAT